MPRASTTRRKSVRSSAEHTAASAITTIGGAQRYLDSCINIERLRPASLKPETFKLDRVRALLELFDEPQRELKFVHVAGSKGKGSVCEMVTSALSACGYTIGLYTSPHLVDPRERVRLGDQPITQAAFVKLVERLRVACDAIEPAHGPVTYFELFTVLALAHFAEMAVDVAVMETGLGGRLDCTNIVEPEVVGLTSVQLEHTHILGDTLEKIAREKAGIMKPGVTAITVPQAPEVLEVFRQTAEDVGAQLAVLGEDIDFSWRFEAAHDMGPHARVSIVTERSSFEHLPSPLDGEHQAENTGLALAILDKLRERGYETPEREVAVGLARTPRMGRMELAWERPRILLDGAHNPESLAALVKAIGSTIRYDSMVVIFGCAADKNVDGMLTEIARGADKIIFTRSAGNPRAADPAELCARYEELAGKTAQSIDDLKLAINTAHAAMSRDDLMCVTGSFYIAGEAKALLDEAKRKRAST